MSKLIFFITMFAMYDGYNYRGQTSHQNFGINYDVILEPNAIPIGLQDSIVIANDNHVIFESKRNLSVGQIVVTSDQFVGIITSKSLVTGLTQYMVDPYHSNLIKEGKIHLFPLNREMEIPMCFGFNTDPSCQHPLKDLILFDNSILKVDCDDCYSSLGGDLFMDLEFSNFHLKSLSLGLKKLHLRGGLGVTVDGHDHWSYVYDKIYSLVNQQKLVSFNIGFLNFDLYLDLPVEVDFRAEATINSQVKYGVDVDVNLGDLYLQYAHGRWQVVKTQPIVTTQPYLSASESVHGQVYFAIQPLVSLYSPGLFHLNLHFDPHVEMSLDESLVTREVCVDGHYQTNVIFNGDVLREKIKDMVVYDSGLKQVIHKCYPLPR